MVDTNVSTDVDTGRHSGRHSGRHQPSTSKGRTRRVATIDECRAALDGLATRLAGVDAEARERHTADRTLSLTVTDLDVSFRGRLVDGALTDMELDTGGGGKAQLRLRCSSDDLISLTTGDLGVGSAWATGRLKIDASLPDLLRLRSLL